MLNDARRKALSVLAVIGVIGGMLLVSSPADAAGSSRHPRASSNSRSCGQPNPTLASDAATRSVKATKAELVSIETAISAEQLCVTDLSEEYDNATYRLGQLDSQIKQTRTDVAQASQDTQSAMLELKIRRPERLHVRRATRTDPEPLRRHDRELLVAVPVHLRRPREPHRRTRFVPFRPARAASDAEPAPRRTRPGRESSRDRQDRGAPGHRRICRHRAESSPG